MSDQCSERFDDYTRADVALDAIFFFIYVAVLIAWIAIRFANIRKKSPLKWYFYGFALITVIL
jgi:hypothetical protein